MAQIPPSSSSWRSLSRRPGWRYDVFLSFRGEDTREGFTSHLYHALCKAGIYTFMDVRLSKGEEIAAQLLRKIEHSRFSIVVFSENYAGSRWCLDELVKIMDCKASKQQEVIPVFYKVEPSEIRHQTGKTRDHLRSFDNFRENSVKLPKWRTALKESANLSGWTFEHGIEPQLIQDIVTEVSRKLNLTSLSVAYYPVGLDDHIERIDPLLGIGMEDEVRMIGIYGDEGIGKSTIAKAIYNLHGHSFEGRSFLANVKATSGSGQTGLVKVQETLLSETLGGDKIRLGNSDKGVSVIVHRLRFKKVLLVIDDVDELEQLRQLAGDKEWFGSGSRIIITTQDSDLLQAHGVEHQYRAERLSYVYSYQLFCWNAFRKLEPPEAFVELCQRVIKHIEGIPQALIMIGSCLYGRSKEEWEVAIALLEEYSNGGGWEQILEITIDGLKQFQKAIFLIIACFLNGRSREAVMRICDISESLFDFGVEELTGKSLVSVQQDRVWVSESLREPAKNILRSNSRIKSRVLGLLKELDEATDELGDGIESAVRSLFDEIFKDSDDDDEEDVVDELANLVESGARTAVRVGGEVVEEVLEGAGTVVRVGEEVVEEVLEGFGSMLSAVFSFFD